MRNLLDFSSWPALASTLLGLIVVTLIAVGIRMLFMHTVQRRRERENRQINERLKTLIAAYKTLGGSFTGELAVDPRHLRELRQGGEGSGPGAGSERRRRVRDAVEAALSDVILLGTEEQVRLAVQAAADMVAGRNVQTAALVVSLRGFIRAALDLEPIPPGLAIPDQGPLRTAAAGAARRGAGEPGGRDKAGGGNAQGGDGALAGVGLHAAAADDHDKHGSGSL